MTEKRKPNPVFKTEAEHGNRPPVIRDRHRLPVAVHLLAAIDGL